MDAEAAATLAALVAELCRSLAARGPAPRALPGFGLEHASGSAASLLDALCGHGIFRKYERVLALADGLGGVGRWLALRRGCTAIALAASDAEAAGGAVVTRRAALRRQVLHLVGRPHALPVGTAAVTHVWIVEQLPRVDDADAVLAEARRALRPGGHLGVQDLVVRDARRVPALPGWSFTTLAARAEALRRAGFVDLHVHEAGDARERSAQVLAARERLDVLLARTPVGAAIAAERRALESALEEGTLGVAQLVARNP